MYSDSSPQLTHVTQSPRLIHFPNSFLPTQASKAPRKNIAHVCQFQALIGSQNPAMYPVYTNPISSATVTNGEIIYAPHRASDSANASRIAAYSR